MLVTEIKASRELDTAVGLMVLGKVYQHHYVLGPQGRFYCYGCGQTDDNSSRICHAIVPKYSSEDRDAWVVFQHIKDSTPGTIYLSHGADGYTLDANNKLGDWNTPLTHKSFPLLVCKVALQLFKVEYINGMYE